MVETLAKACDGAISGEFAALVTGPVQKSIINDAGIPFIGHTEFFADRSHCQRVVMMLATEELRVALATTHLPLLAVPGAITQASLHEVITILDNDLKPSLVLLSHKFMFVGLILMLAKGDIWAMKRSIQLFLP